MTIRSTFIPLVVAATICMAGWGFFAFSQTIAPDGVEPPCVHEFVYEAVFGVSLVQLEVENSQPLTFLVDTGASQSALTDPLMAQGLGLEPGGFGLSRGLGAGAKPTVISKEVTLRHRGVEILRTQFAVHDIGPALLRQSGRNIDGIIGSDLFNRYVVEFEPLGRRLRLHDPETFKYRGDGWVLPLVIEDRRPVIGARVVVKGDKVIPVKLMVDTGSSRTLSLLIGSRRRLKPPAGTLSSTSMGITGEVDVQYGRIERLEISSITLANVETSWVEPYRVPATGNIDGLNGILGNRFLEMFRVIFDYNGGRLILERPRQITAIQPPITSSSD